MVNSKKPIRCSGHASSFSSADPRSKMWRKPFKRHPGSQQNLGGWNARKTFDTKRHGTERTTPQTGPIFVEELDEIVVVTVYVYYF